MKNRVRSLALLSGVVFAFCLNDAAGAQVGGSPSISYKPPLIPIAVTLSAKGITVSIEQSIQTPIGEFTVGLGQYDTEPNNSYLRLRTLTVIVGTRATVYQLEARPYRVEFPSDASGKNTLSWDGRGNITVRIPDPIQGRAWRSRKVIVPWSTTPPGWISIVLEGGPMAWWNSFEFELDGKYHRVAQEVVGRREVARFKLTPGKYWFRFDLKTGTPPLRLEVKSEETTWVLLKMRGWIRTNVSVFVNEVLVHDTKSTR